MNTVSRDRTMISIGILTGALALLCLIGGIVYVIRHKLSKKEGGKSSGLKGIVFVLGFFPMLFMSLSSFRTHSAYLTQFFAYVRNSFVSVEFLFDSFFGFGELSVVLDFFTAIIFGSTVAITLAGGLEPRCVADHLSGKGRRDRAVIDLKDTESREVSASYLTFCRYLS